jgi:RNA polymerase sigma factor (sigma-70 family)
MASDAELLARSRADPAAFGTFYDRHVAAVLAFCLRRTGSAEIAADLTAETFAAAYAKRAQFRETGVPAVGWLYGIARRQVGTYHRRQAVSDRYRRRFGFEALTVAPDDADRIAALVDLEPIRSQLRVAVAALPDGQADAVRLRLLDGLGYPEIADRLGCTVGAARVRVSRALSALADAMEGTW